MAFSTAGRSGPLADINITPLVDVMLVLLIIFIVTTPILARPIDIALPQRIDRAPDRVEPPPIELRLDAASQLTWNGVPVAVAVLPARLQAEADAHAGHVPELRIATDPAADYQALVTVLAAADAAGMQRIRFEQR